MGRERGTCEAALERRPMFMKFMLAGFAAVLSVAAWMGLPQSAHAVQPAPCEAAEVVDGRDLQSDGARLEVVSALEADSYLTPGWIVSFPLTYSFSPAWADEEAFWADDEAGDLWGFESFKVTSSNRSVLEALIVDDEYGASLELEAVAPGTSKLTISYEATGKSGTTYRAVQNIDVAVAEKENPIASIKVDSTRLNVSVATSCAICGYDHWNFEDSQIPVKLVGKDPSKPVTIDSGIDVACDESVAYANYDYLAGVISIYPVAYGKASITVTPYDSDSYMTQKAVSIDLTVTEAGDPTLIVRDSVTVKAPAEGESAWLSIVGEASAWTIASYKEDAAFAVHVDGHGDAFAFGYPDGVWSVASSNESVLKVIEDEYGQVLLEVVGEGTANVAVTDVWGNEGTCAVTVVPADAACLRDETCPISIFDDASAKAWYHDGAHWALETGILKGYTNAAGELTGLGPNDSTTRAQVAVMLHRYAARCGFDVSAEEPIPPFKDAAKIGTWAVDAIQWACEKGILKGYGDGSELGPNDNVTREQLAVMIHRFAGVYGIDTSEAADVLSFKDSSKIGSFAVPALQWVYAEGIMTGYTGAQEGYLGPKDKASRVQVATMIQRLDALE